MCFIPAPAITTKEGKINLTVSEVAVLCFNLCYNLFSFITNVTFILASEITTEGKINVKSISIFNTLFCFYVLIFSHL